ncbi:hypothetical protein SanaruYs_05690 [Chryseotalea sanaruensis]|uniref:Integrase catalytic domain-containing protein n=1 Tax=Chryseotalea sanaruensis TaxID=2482724 RepID=A0A401U5W9_9BACT|nr:hypothetical protein [Chryseotalea sanaruensis]GCC50354.1 hypothetical protein SanaruYs_05690 [Chryseotalea sanaruensis]
MVFYTKTELALITKLFKVNFDKKRGEPEMYYHSSLPKLLSGKGDPDTSPKFIPLRLAPETIKKHLSPEICKNIFQQLQGINYQAAVQTITFESYFLTRLRELFLTSDYKEDFRSYQPIYASYDFLTGEKIVELSMLHAMIVLIDRFLYDPTKIKIIYQHLCECNYGVEIPLTSLVSFKKYIKRKKNNLPDSIIHGLYQQKSNNHEISELMQYLIIWIYVMVPTRRASFSIKEDVDYIIQTMPNAEEQGIYTLSESKIAKFLLEPKSVNLISYAKDNKEDFRRKVSGVMRFIRASAPLVRIYLDGYVFQVEHKDGKKVGRLTGLFISDDFSDYIISHVIGNSENFELVMLALEEYFRKTKNALPREIVVDKYTYKILKKNTAFIDLLKRNGIEKGRGLTVSSNPNRKSRLERFFNTFQQKFMQSIIHYIGPGIKARLSNSHPFKEFLITLKKDLPDQFDITLTLNRLIKYSYNKEYISPSQEYLSTPESRFKNEDPNPHCIVDPKVIPMLFYELHQVMFKAGAIMIKRGVEFHLFYMRDFEFINQYNGRKVDAYYNKNSSGTSILVYEKDTSNFIAEIPLFKIIPSALYDRNEKHNEILKGFSKQTRELLSSFKNEFIKMEETLKSAFNGRDIRAFTKLAKMKKEVSSEQEMAQEMNLKENKAEPKLYNSNLGRRKTKSRNELESLGITITDTI